MSLPFQMQTTEDMAWMGHCQNCNTDPCEVVATFAFEFPENAAVRCQGQKAMEKGFGGSVQMYFVAEEAIDPTYLMNMDFDMDFVRMICTKWHEITLTLGGESYKKCPSVGTHEFPLQSFTFQTPPNLFPHDQFLHGLKIECCLCYRRILINTGVLR